MKKHKSIFSFFCFLFLSTFSFAQPSLGLSLTFGNPSFEEIRGLSFNFGLVTEYPINEYLDLKSGLQYSRRTVGAGFMYEGPVWNLNTLSVPFVGKFKLPKEEFEIYADMGASAGWVINPEYKLVDVSGEDIIDGVEFRKYEIGLLLGAGVQYKTEKVALYIEMRYRKSLNDLTAVDDEYDLKIGTIEVMNIGVLIPVRQLE